MSERLVHTYDPRGMNRNLLLVLLCRSCPSCGKDIPVVELDKEGNGVLGKHDCDYVCAKCGHEPCPCCQDWCDVMVADADGDAQMCCGGKCEFVRKVGR